MDFDNRKLVLKVEESKRNEWADAEGVPVITYRVRIAGNPPSGLSLVSLWLHPGDIGGDPAVGDRYELVKVEKLCGDKSPSGLSACELETGHSAHHQNGHLLWENDANAPLPQFDMPAGFDLAASGEALPELCDGESPYGRCLLNMGHDGDHRSMIAADPICGVSGCRSLSDTDQWCRAVALSGVVCSLAKGHTGQHRACGLWQHNVAEPWANDTDTSSASVTPDRPTDRWICRSSRGFSCMRESGHEGCHQSGQVEWDSDVDTPPSQAAPPSDYKALLDVAVERVRQLEAGIKTQERTIAGLEQDLRQARGSETSLQGHVARLKEAARQARLALYGGYAGNDSR